MKNYLVIIITCLGLQVTIAQSNWQGGWETQHGNVEIIVSKGYVYGLYANVGWLYGKIAPGSKRIVGTFWNEEQKNTGRFEWNLNNAGTAFTGKWAWGEDFKTLQQLNGGNWNGTKSSSKSVAKPWTKTYITNAGELQIIHMGGKRALGLLNEVVFCGKVLDNKSLTGVLKTIDVVGIAKPYGTSFSISQTNNALSGHWFKPSGKENLTGTLKGYTPPQNNINVVTNTPKKEYTIRVTWNTLKLNKARRGNSDRFSFWFNTAPTNLSSILYRLPHSKHAENKNYRSVEQNYEYRSLLIVPEQDVNNFGETHTVGVERKVINQIYEFKIGMSLNEIKSKRLKFINKLRYNPSGLNIKDYYLEREINIVEVLQYLTKEVNASDFPDAVHGRKRLSNSSDTFWLEEIAGKRQVRGYGDLIFENNVRFGYSYTIELID